MCLCVLGNTYHSSYMMFDLKYISLHKGLVQSLKHFQVIFYVKNHLLEENRIYISLETNIRAKVQDLSGA